MAAPAEIIEPGEVLTFARLPYMVGWPEAATVPDDRRAVDAFCLNADNVSWLAGHREYERIQAWQIVDARRENLRSGEFDEVPLDVDAVGTAVKVAWVKEVFGDNSPEYVDAREGLLTDCRRKIAEAYRKNKWEYFGVSVQRYDPDTDMLFANGLPVDEMMANGLSPLGETEELERRINDAVNHAGIKEMIRRPEMAGAGVIHISLCPDWAIKSYIDNPKAAHGGYAPEKEKLMANFDWFDHASGEVFHAQVGLSGEYITPEVVNDTYQALGISSEGVYLDKTEIHATQGVVSTEHVGDIFGLVRILDEFASLHSGRTIFMGEVVDVYHPRDYTQVIIEADRRRVEQAALSEELTRFVESLHAKGVDHALGTVMVEKFIQEKLLDRAQANPELAEVIFDYETAHGFREAQRLHALGQREEAEQLLREVRINAPAVSSCGAGSCGLESVRGGENQEIKDLLNFKGGETLLKDTIRKCPNCNQKTIVYAFTATNVKKACTNSGCGMKDFNGTKSVTAAPESREPMTFLSADKKKAFRLGAEATGAIK